MRTHDINSNCIGIYSADKKVLQVALTVTDHKILVILLKATVYLKFGFWKHKFQIGINFFQFIHNVFKYHKPCICSLPSLHPKTQYLSTK